MAKRQICFQLEEEQAKEMEVIRDETGLPISRQLELKLKGYKIVKFKDIEKQLEELRNRIDDLEKGIHSIEMDHRL